MDSCDVAIVGSGFAGALLARILVTLGYDVALVERGAHPRFAIGESSTPLANLSLERLATRYGLTDCYQLSTHGRWLADRAELRRGLKRGFTFYRHHPGAPFANRDLESERLLVAASPNDAISDTHWLRADIDHHFVREAISAGVDYRDRTELTGAEFGTNDIRLSGTRDGGPFTLRTRFVIDASGPGGFLSRQLAIPSALEGSETRSALVFSHFEDVALMSDVVRGLPEGPYPDDWAAVHHIIDEGWMYSLRFDHGTTSAGFLLTPRGLATFEGIERSPDALWRAVLGRYPTLSRVFGNASPTMPIAFRSSIQHRLARATGNRWLLLPHAFAFVDPLFSTGIAWSLRAVERLGLMFEDAKRSGTRLELPEELARYESALIAEADQIDRLVAGAYEARTHFDLFAAQAMLYFATVSFAEVGRRIAPTDNAPWNGFLGVGDPVLAPLPWESHRRLLGITQGRGDVGDARSRREFVDWIAESIAPRNVAGLADPRRHNLYPVDLDLLVERHELLGMTREQMVDALPALRGMAATPEFVRP